MLYDKLVNVLASKGKAIEDIKHINLLHWYSNGLCIDTDKYLETLKKSYSTGCCDSANIVLDNAVVKIIKYYDREWKVYMEYIGLEKKERG